ncbi:hypothetical protein AAV35_008265 [Salimicrobium jeotgali]|uniref:Uncharacterized protein n=1 Tax=Salimicrobium jeotgali TaxID=1230341 RepID=K2FHE2_9BACI|nr:hypothetical protein [Salimicrobium jeotgali]AKG04795.1 hypothetical protein AAV35_008265 [Salimicrobium jeotgali]EKE30536.1 hypothetical protein MJ3_12709 [Salimicrobium jeotgali]MBM7696768.1 hypothetical protein [Salimicrobium jeotgali]
MNKEEEILEELKKTNHLLEAQKDEVTPFQAVMDMVRSLLVGIFIVGPVLALILAFVNIIGD